jgi:hypothetical protein
MVAFFWFLSLKFAGFSCTLGFADLKAKDPNWYLVQEGDATMFLIVTLPGQKLFLKNAFIAVCK